MAADKEITIKEYLAAPAIMKRTEEMLDKRAGQFTASVLALASQDPKIMACEPRSLFNACLTAAALNLPINKNLGFAHIIPYKNNKTGLTEAQFQMGWQGFVQLAQRTSQYKTISATEVYEGQLIDENPMTGNTYDWKAKASDTVIGYVGYFKLTNGFEHELYMSKEQIEAHARRYSQAYKYDLSAKKSLSPWSTDYDSMARKTVLKLNIAKFGPMSVDLERALVNDQAVIRDTGAEYVDGTDLLDDEKATDEQRKAILAANGVEVGEITEDGKVVVKKAPETKTDLTDKDKAEIEAKEKAEAK